MTTYVICIAVSFLASVAGSICGIGGGVLIKPVLDAFGALDVASISFLSGCTVLSMSCYSVLKAGRGRTDKDGSSIKALLAAGSVLGGIAGKTLFRHISEMAANPQHTGAGQPPACSLSLWGQRFIQFRRRISEPAGCKNRLRAFSWEAGWASVPPFLESGEDRLIWPPCFTFFRWIQRRRRRARCISLYSHRPQVFLRHWLQGRRRLSGLS